MLQKFLFNKSKVMNSCFVLFDKRLNSIVKFLVMKVGNNPIPASIPGGKLNLIFKFSGHPSHDLIFNVSGEYKIKAVSSSFSFGFLTSAVLENSITSVLLFSFILFIMTFPMAILCSFIV